MLERIDKILASQGTTSRKEARALLRAGRVEVDGAVLRAPEEKVDPDVQEIRIDGERLRYRKHIYLMMNKPAGVVCASRDPKARTVVDLVPEQWRRKGLFPAGRLDKDTQGLLIITDDGDFAHRMLSPKKGVFKLYEARLDGAVDEEQRQAFAQGVVFADGTRCLPAELIIPAGQTGETALVRIQEGKYHQVKRMFLAVGRTVLSLRRLAIGRLRLDDSLKLGECRELGERERLFVFDAQKDDEF